MQQMQNNLSGIIGTVVQTAGSLTGSAASMRTAGDQIHRRMDQQSQQTQQAATAMQEMSACIAEVSRHTQSAAETARSAAETARDGGTIVKQVLGSMHSIATAVSDTSATVGLLGDDSRRISQIVTVIDEIARKTNLLALNAAIEAARAGDQGRGFAVVAGEVRRLAESTAQATGEIATMIQGIQDRTRTAIASMESGTGTVEQGVVTTTQAGEALEKIIGMAERVDRMITQIAIAASQQTVAADQSSASLDAIHSLSHENLSEMATTAAGIESLRTTAVTLEQQVDRFSLKSAPDTRLVPSSIKQSNPTPPFNPHDTKAFTIRNKKEGLRLAGFAIPLLHKIPALEDLEVNLDVQLHQHRLSVFHRWLELYCFTASMAFSSSPMPTPRITRTWLGCPLVSTHRLTSTLPATFALRASSENSGSTE